MAIYPGQRSRRGAMAAALALVVSACGGGGGGGSTSTTTSTTIGKGEGSLNVIEWPYYTDKSFAQPFELGGKRQKHQCGASRSRTRKGGDRGGGTPIDWAIENGVSARR